MRRLSPCHFFPADRFGRKVYTSGRISLPASSALKMRRSLVAAFTSRRCDTPHRLSRRVLRGGGRGGGRHCGGRGRRGCGRILPPLLWLRIRAASGLRRLSLPALLLPERRPSRCSHSAFISRADIVLCVRRNLAPARIAPLSRRRPRSRQIDLRLIFGSATRLAFRIGRLCAQGCLLISASD